MYRRDFVAATTVTSAPAACSPDSLTPIWTPAGPAAAAQLSDIADEDRETLDVEAFRAGDPYDGAGNPRVFNRALAEAGNRGGGVICFSRDYDIERINVSGNVTLHGQRHRLRLVGRGDNVVNVSRTGAHFREIVFETTTAEQYSAIWIVGAAENCAPSLQHLPPEMPMEKGRKEPLIGSTP